MNLILEDNSLLFDYQYMLPKIYTALNNKQYKKTGYSCFENCIIKLATEFLRNYNIFIYYGFVNAEKLHCSGGSSPITFYTNTNLIVKIDMCCFMNGSGTCISYKLIDKHDSYSESIQPGCHVSNRNLQHFEKMLEKVYKYIDPHIYADYLLCCESKDIKYTLFNNDYESDELKKNNQKLKELYTATKIKYSNLENSTNEIQEKLVLIEKHNSKNEEKILQLEDNLLKLQNENKELIRKLNIFEKLLK